MPKTPSYRRRPGYTQAIVTLTDAVTKKRRDYWLGPHGTKESREQYHRVIAEWKANGRRLPRAVSIQTTSKEKAGPKLVTIRDEEGYYRYRDYIHMNPVKHDCAENSSDWPWSSVHRHVSDGWLHPDGPDASPVDLPRCPR